MKGFCTVSGVKYLLYMSKYTVTLCYLTHYFQDLYF